MKSIYFTMLAICTFFLTLAPTVDAAEGDLDLDFGDGIIHTGLRSRGFFYQELDIRLANGGVCVATQGDGKILVAGLEYTGNMSWTYFIMRFTENGFRDNDFGANGLAYIDDLYSPGSLTNSLQPLSEVGMLVQDDGRILLVGFFNDVYWGANSFIARFDTFGQLDPSFGDIGIIETEYITYSANRIQLALQADGKILFAAPTGINDVQLVRFDSSGQLDTGFGAAGMVIPANGNWPYRWGLAVQPDNMILFAGRDGTLHESCVTRYDASGALDPTFGIGGVASVGMSSHQSGLALQANGGILLSGRDYAQDEDFVTRFDSMGHLDMGFGSNGVASAGFVSLLQNRREVLAHPNGGIFLACVEEAVNKAYITCFDSNGLVDVSFGGDGTVHCDIDCWADEEYPPLDLPVDLALQAEDEVLLAGIDGHLGEYCVARYDLAGNLVKLHPGYAHPKFATKYYSDISVVSGEDNAILFAGASYDSGCTFITCFDSTGSRDLNFGDNGIARTGLDDCNMVSMATQADGNFIVAGIDRFYEMAYAARFDNTGMLDPGFGTGGIVYTGFLSDIYSGVSVTTQTDGKILLAFTAKVGGEGDGRVIRIDGSTGTIDLTFGESGFASCGVGCSMYKRFDVAAQVDGKVLLAGEDLGDEGILVCFDANGIIDPGFGDDGIVYTGIIDPMGRELSVATHADGKILLAGYDDTLKENYIMRFDATGMLDPEFGVAGIAHTGASSEDYSVFVDLEIQTDGKIVLGSTDGSLYEYFVARFDINGELDPTFGDDGVVLTGNMGHPLASHFDIEIQENDKILLAGIEAGWTSEDCPQPFVARYHASSEFLSPIIASEPTFTIGTTNTIEWGSYGMENLVQCAEDPAFSVGIQESGWTTEFQYAFTDLSDGQIYYYRVKSRISSEESDWSDTVYSTQDDSAPESSADPLADFTYNSTFDIPYSASDATSGIANVELFWADQTPDTMQFGWEDGTSTALHATGLTGLHNSTTLIHDGHHSLGIRLGITGDGRAYLAWVRGLAEGDEVTAGFWCHDPNGFSDPKGRIWGHWNDDPSDIVVHDGDAGGHPYYTMSSGWSFQEYVWTVPAGHTGLVIEADIVGDNLDRMYIDDLEIGVPAHATVMIPDNTVFAPIAYTSYGAFTGSPILFTAPGEGTFGFYTVATDNAGIVEDTPTTLPDAMTTVLLPSDVQDQPELPIDFAMQQNAPNPFNPVTKIRYDLPEPCQVTLHVYDLSGRLIRTLRQGVMEEAGHHNVVWNGTDDRSRAVSSGVYMYRLTAGKYTETRRMVLVR